MRRTYRRLAFIVPVASLVGLSGLAVNGTSQAAVKAPTRAGAPAARTQAGPDVQFYCSGTIYRQCYLQTQAPPKGGSGNAPLFAPNGTLHALLPLNDKVLVTCYYFGNPPAPYAGDGVEDHVTWENTIGNYTGHIPDSYIDEGNANPWDYPYDLNECG